VDRALARRSWQAGVLVLMDLDDGSVTGPGGLAERLAVLPDPRSRHGLRHPLAGMLTIAAAAVLGGARGFTAIAEFAHDLPQATLARLGMWQRPYSDWYVAPSETALRQLLQRLDPDELDRVLGGWLAEQTRPATDNDGDGGGDGGAEAADGSLLPAVAVDGKVLRGARQPDGHQIKLFAAIVHGQGTVIAQREVPSHTNEITQFQPLLDQVDLAGRVVTADALHTQADHARWLVTERHADYVFCVKGNQAALEAAIDHLPQAAFSPCLPGHQSGARPGGAAHDPDRPLPDQDRR